MTPDENDDDLISHKDLKKFALGNTILFFACMIFPLGEGLFAIFTHLKKLGNSWNDYKCIVMRDQTLPISYDPNGDDYQNIMQLDVVTDVSKNFRYLNLFTIFCMIFA